jgi:hypothetical protein
MYPDSGISLRPRVTRSEVVERSFGISGNGMPDNQRYPRRGADPTKNESGRTGTFSFNDTSFRSVSAGNGFIVANFFSREFRMSWMEI